MCLRRSHKDADQGLARLPSPTSRRAAAGFRRRAGFSMIELMMAMVVMVVVGGALAGLASAVWTGNDFSQGLARATQHGRVANERITRMVNTSASAEDHPGFVVIDTFQDGHRFPDTLVVWHPGGLPANPQGPPLVRELVIYCPDPADPRQLVEITAPGDSRAAPFPDLNTPAWAPFVEGIKTDPGSEKVVLTNLLRVAAAGGGGKSLRGAVRFERRVLPSLAQWSDYRSGGVAWNSIAWPQGIYGSQRGLRQAWLRIELQIMPKQTVDGESSSGSQVIPFFGSASLYYELSK